MLITKKKSIPQTLYFLGLFLMAVGLPLSKFLINVSQFVLLGSLLLDKDVIPRLKHFFSNKITLTIFAVYLLHIIGITYSEDLNYAIDDIRKKLPLLILTLVISTNKPISEKIINLVLVVFCLSVILNTFIGVGILHGFIHSSKVNYPIENIRDISIFVSHIRLGLFIVLSICMLSFFAFRPNNLLAKTFSIIGIIWLVFYLVLTGALTGIIILVAIIFLFSVSNLLSKSINYTPKVLSGVVLSVFVLGLCYIGYLFVKPVITTNKNSATNNTHTINNNEYDILPNANQTEDGKKIYEYYCRKELNQEWPKYSNKHLDSLTKQNHGALIYSLLRYMTSMNLSKDSVGLTKLSKDDIIQIENGATNYRIKNMNEIEKRLYDIKWEIAEYKNTGDANGHTLAQRYVYWKNGLQIIKQNLLFGVGTGDIQNALFASYQINEPTLEKKYYLRTHNQFISIGISFGIIGLIVFITSIILPLFYKKYRQNTLYISFVIIFIGSMITEDTLETLAGVSFYAFFNSLFLFAIPKTTFN